MTFGAPAASAHGAMGDDAPASNYRSVVTDAPSVDGVTVRTIEAGSQLELVNLGDQEVVVLDYDGRPYLRIGPDGVLENQHSPAAYLNQSPDGSAVVPDGIGDGPPVWQRVSGERSYRWHDHRAHWMGGDHPLVIARPDQRHTVAEWVVPLRVGERSVGIEGVTEWVPGPTPLPSILLAAAVAATLAALVLRKWHGTAILLAVLGIGSASIAIAIGSWQASAEAALDKVPMLPLPFFIATLLLGALAVSRTRPRDSLLLAACAGATAALTTVLNNGDWLTRSQLPTALSPTVARTAVSITIGAGLGLAIAATWLTMAPLLRANSAGSAPGDDDSDDDGSDDDAAAPSTGVRDSARIRRTIAIGFVVTMVAVGVVGQLSASGSPEDLDATTAIGEVCRAITTAPSDGGLALRRAFSGPPHDVLHDLAARVEAEDRTVSGELLRAKQAIEASLKEPDADIEPGSALPVAIRRASNVLGDVSPADCAPEP